MPKNPTVILRIKRRRDPESAPYWEEFEIPRQPNMNVISCLMAIRKHPVTRDGKATSPPVWEMNCLENVCGSCQISLTGASALPAPL